MSFVVGRNGVSDPVNLTTSANPLMWLVKFLPAGLKKALLKLGVVFAGFFGFSAGASAVIGTLMEGLLVLIGLMVVAFVAYKVWEWNRKSKVSQFVRKFV